MTIPIGTPVRVYWNFHRKLFSVQVKGEKGWRVVGHVRSLRLENVTFHVNQAGRERVLRERKKNVHAKIHGTVCKEKRQNHGGDAVLVGYNPYYLNAFYAYRNQVEKTTSLEIVKSAKYVVLYVPQANHPSIHAKGFK